jgi:hypothetical protein
MPYKDPDKRRQAVRESVRRLRASGDDVNPVNPAPVSDSPVNPVNPILLKLIDRQNEAEKEISVLRQTIDVLVEKVESLTAEVAKKPFHTTDPHNNYRRADGELEFSKARQAAGKLPKDRW